MSGARILAAGGTAAAVLTMLGGFASMPMLVGAAGLVMLTANILVLIGAGTIKEHAK